MPSYLGEPGLLSDGVRCWRKESKMQFLVERQHSEGLPLYIIPNVLRSSLPLICLPAAMLLLAFIAPKLAKLENPL